MKKVALAAFIATSLMASDSGLYVGVDFGNTAVELEANINGTSTTAKDDGGSQTYKLGYYLNQNNRLTSFYQHVNADGASSSAYGLGYDYLIGNGSFKPFLGFLVGRGSMKLDGTSVEIDGNIYGAQAGANYSFNENFSVEAGYRVFKSNMEGSITGPGGTATFEIDPIKNWFIGANYKF